MGKASSDQIIDEPLATSNLTIWKIFVPDAYEYYYADHRGEGVEYVAEYCEEKSHLKIPKQVLNGQTLFHL